MGSEDETLVRPGRMASPEYGPDYAADESVAARRHGTETKPFLLTSEFVGAVLAIVALAVTAATTDSVDATLFWLLTTGIVAAYLFSRGFAKNGSTSHAWDPRETPARWWGRRTEHWQEARRQRDEARAQSRGGSTRVRLSPAETRPFFLTSEFWATALTLAGLAIAAATTTTIDARLFWILARQPSVRI